MHRKFGSHFLARKSISGNKLQVWIESTPNDIALLVTHDSLKLCFSSLISLTLESVFSKKKKKKELACYTKGLFNYFLISKEKANHYFL